MAYTYKNATGSTRYAAADGAGSSGDPDVPKTMPNYGTTVIFNSGGTGGAADGDIRDASNHDFTVSDELLYASQRGIYINNGLDQAITFEVFAQISSVAAALIYSASVPAATQRVLLPHAVGTGGNAVEVAALASPLGTSLVIRATAGSSPTSGTLSVTADWRA